MNAEQPDKSQILIAKLKFGLEESILILLLVLSLIGIGITDFSPDDGYWYWIIMIFVFALSSMLMGWLQSKKKSGDFNRLLYEQSIHWGCSLLVVFGAFSILHAGKLTSETTGLVILLILSLSTCLDGLRVGWRFSLTGLFLGFSVIIAAYLENFMWLELVLAVVIVAATIAWEIWTHKKSQTIEPQND